MMTIERKYCVKINVNEMGQVIQDVEYPLNSDEEHKSLVDDFVKRQTEALDVLRNMSTMNIHNYLLEVNLTLKPEQD